MKSQVLLALATNRVVCPDCYGTGIWQGISPSQKEFDA
jgi:hypothetical protein